jgi:hypothetical protein
MNLSLLCFDTISELILTSVGNFIRGAVSKVKEGFECEGAATAEDVTEGADVGTAVGTAVATDALGAKVSSIDLR